MWLLILLGMSTLFTSTISAASPAANYHLYFSEPKTWMPVRWSSISKWRSLHNPVFIFANEPNSFRDAEKAIWKHAVAAGLKRSGDAFTDIMFVDRVPGTGRRCVDELYAALPHNRFQPNDVECIGVGAGANFCGLLAKKFVDKRKAKIGRILALDPVGMNETEIGPVYVQPLGFELIDVASFVEAVHTSVLGTARQMGHVDIFVNSALIQPQCLPSHLAEAITDQCHETFVMQCPSLEELQDCSSSTDYYRRYCNLEESNLEYFDEAPDSVDKTSIADWADQLYEVLKPSQERAALLYAASFGPNLNTLMCSCAYETVVKDFRECPDNCSSSNGANFGQVHQAGQTSERKVYWIGTGGTWPYFDCTQKRVPSDSSTNLVEDGDS